MGLVCMNVGEREFIVFVFLCGTKSEYIRLIQLCAIYDATHCFLVT